MKQVEVTLMNEEGLHARPASIFAKTAFKFKSDIKVYKNGNKDKEYNPKSILSVLSMGAAKGDTLLITAEGEDEDLAVEELKKLVESKFGE
ncbi:MAG: phosphocarrier protein HPr [Epulopiscium sp.]|uniref:Phosphocarrier protein HPr n=1 Tax=Defluviitalea raffinosedens TaxID=1450156 RepID=A0A7C8HEF7_9FIRM|nr:HPr family phosphocarrier protein [Defluviitalea raffinosedens]MBZ4668777.1 HPr family phosphocarrier protein [Defluviitaleaceae bacterium]MDK2786984.1 phosphocarrier protein HPr [Candidatus Epulonipiscium sp.]KAE9630209.1 HPr family phosphocarrier protein [Defluviitalea raffinosedens]MBM7686011.1 phosphotransferase system HPr (HPr) family protein [Defluviitalea raffinosedens]HHW67742.1 HPr family phosphocarrier protein [Candidatus Epulonipiscium sp.]